MRHTLADKRYGGYIWHFLFAGLFIGLSLLFLSFTEGVAWYLISSSLRIVFGAAVLFTASRLFEKTPLEILSVKNLKAALIAGSGFLLFLLYHIVTVVSGIGRISGLTAGILLSRIVLQQLTTGFYEELNYRFLPLEGLKYTADNTGMKLLYVMISTVLFGLLHCVTGWDTYTFLQTGAIGFAFAVIYVKSGNLVLPMALHFLYDVFANMTGYIEWNDNPFFQNASAVFEIMLALMFVISLIILIVPDKHAEP